MKNRIVSFLLAFVMIVSMIPFTTFAEGASENEGTLPRNETGSADVSYKGQGGTAESTDDYTLINENIILWENGTYVAAGNVTLSGSVTVVGTVDLILCDGATLTVSGVEGKAAIYVPDGNTLNIYGQNGTSGKLLATGGDFAAGIGGSDVETFDELTADCGVVNVYGGRVTAVGGSMAAGIGGAYAGTAESISIYGGIVIVRGDEFFASAIGAGEEGADTAKVLFAGGYTHASGNEAVIGDVTIADELCAYDFDTPQQQYSSDGWRVGYKGNPSKDVLIGPCTYIEKGEERAFPAYISIYDGETEFSTGFRFVMDDFALSKQLKVTDKSQIVLADGVTLDVRNSGRQTGSFLQVFATSSGDAQGRMLGGLAYNELGKTVSITDFTKYKGANTLSAGTYYVTENYEIDGFLTATGKVILVLADGVTLKADLFEVKSGASFNFYTESLGEDKGIYEGLRMTSHKYLDASGNLCELPDDFVFYNGEATLSTGTYLLCGVGNSGRVTVSGNVVIVLMDGTSTTFDNGISVESGNTLTITAQSNGDAMGSVMFKGGSSSAGIGSNYFTNCGKIVINGGSVKASGDSRSAGIGGGPCGNGGEVIINDGIVTASGGIDGAGIGSGSGQYLPGDSYFPTHDFRTSGGKVTINGGLVTASGSKGGAGIGGGFNGYAAETRINGGTVTATSSDGAAIGGGERLREGDYTTQLGSNVIGYYFDKEIKWCGSGNVASFLQYCTKVYLTTKDYYLSDGTSAEMVNPKVYTKESVLGEGIWFVRENVKLTSPLLLSGDVTLVLADGVTFEVTLGAYFTEKGSFTVGTKSTGSKKGVFIGTVYETTGEGGEGGIVPSDMQVFNGETLLNAAYLVTENFTADEPLVIDGNAALFICDDVVFDASRGYVLTDDSTLHVYYTSKHDNRGVFIGEQLTNGCDGEEIDDFVTLYSDKIIALTDDCYYVRSNVTLKSAIIIYGTVKIVIPDGVTLDASKGIYLTESADLEVIMLSEGDNAGKMLGNVVTEYIDESGTHPIPDDTVVFDEKSPVISDGTYIVLADGKSNVLSIEDENVVIMIADGATLTASVGFFGNMPIIATFSTGDDAGKFVGNELSYLDVDGNSVIVPADASFYNGETVLESGLWFVGKSQAVSERIKVSGNVIIVLGDGVKLEANKGIDVSAGNSLTITSQSEGTRMGKLYAYTLRYGRHIDDFFESGKYDDDYKSAIGGNDETTGDIYIWNGFVEARAFDSASAIGGGYRVNGGSVTIYGGTVRGFGRDSDYVIGGTDAVVTIYGGNVYTSCAVTTTSDKSGIGGAEVAIYGGEVYSINNTEGAVVADTVIFGDFIRAFDLDNNSIYSNDTFTSAVQSKVMKIRVIDASFVDEGEERHPFGKEGRILTEDDNTLEAGAWYFAMNDVTIDKILTVGEGARLIIANGVTVTAENGVILPASNDSGVYTTTLDEDKGVFVGRLIASYIGEDEMSHALPGNVGFYEGYTELPHENWYETNVFGEDEAWYFVDEDYTLVQTLVIRGTVNLVIADGVKLDLTKGFTIEENGVLKVYYCSAGDNKGSFIGEEKGYIDENGEQKRLHDGFVVYNGESQLVDRWYLVPADITLDSQLCVSGDVVLVIADGVTLNAEKGILLTSGNSLTVCTQSAGDDMGVLIAYGGDLGASAIGGDYFNRDAGDLTINGGNIKAYGGSDAAGIGGGFGGKGGTVIVNGGIIEAVGGAGTSSGVTAAGIGGGYSGGFVKIVINNVESLIAKGGRALGSGIGVEQNKDQIVIDGSLKALSNGETVSKIDSETEVMIVQKDIAFTGISLTLDSDIYLNIYMSLPRDAVNSGVMVFTIGGRTVEGKVRLNEQNGRYYFTCPITVLEMAQTVTATFTYDGEVYTFEYSVKDYVTTILNAKDEQGSPKYPETMLTLARKIANYGYYTQNYLESIHKNVTIDRDGNTEGYPEMLYFAEDDINVGAAEIEDKFIAPEDTDAFTFDGRTVYFESATSLNYYVIVNDGIAPTAVCKDGKDVEVKLYKGNTYIVSVKDIKATELDKQFTVTVGDEENGLVLISSVLDYCGAVIKAHDVESPTEKDLNAINCMAAFYEYHAAAKAYVASLGR